jgi:hypothetical protein
VASTVVQAHVETLQHTPGQTVPHVPPHVNTFGAAHALGASTAQAPVPTLQHLPTHGTGLHVLEDPWYVEPEAQPDADGVVQAQEVVLQHTPGQTVVQVKPCVHVFGATQALCIVTVHTAALVQHRPGCGHGFGEQDEVPGV